MRICSAYALSLIGKCIQQIVNFGIDSIIRKRRSSRYELVVNVFNDALIVFIFLKSKDKVSSFEYHLLRNNDLIILILLAYKP